MILGEDYILNAKDLCTLPFIDKLIEAGIDSFKVEGRNKKEDYVKIITETYREAIDAYFAGKLDDKLKEKLMEKLKTVYHREFNQGFFFGQPIDSFSNTTGSKATKKKTFIGKVINFLDKNKIAIIEIQANPIKVNDNILVIGPTTGTVEEIINSMEIEHKKVKEVKKGLVGIKFKNKVRSNDEVYLWEEIKLN